MSAITNPNLLSHPISCPPQGSVKMPCDLGLDMYDLPTLILSHISRRVGHVAGHYVASHASQEASESKLKLRFVLRLAYQKVCPSLAKKLQRDISHLIFLVKKNSASMFSL